MKKVKLGKQLKDGDVSDGGCYFREDIPEKVTFR